MSTRKTIVFVRSTAIHPEPRLEREIQFLRNEYDIKVLGWDRERRCAQAEEREGYTIFRFRMKAKYGSGWRNMWKVWTWWIYECIWLFRNEFDAVHACDFDALPPALLVAKLRRKKVVYDIFDFYADMLLFTPAFVKNSIRRVDLFCARFVNAAIIPDDSRRIQIVRAKQKKVVVLYNTPPDVVRSFNSRTPRPTKDTTFRIVYIGLLQPERGLDYAVEALAGLSNVEGIIGGRGSRDYEKKLKSSIVKTSNIRFIGKVFPYEKALETLFGCDGMFALYDPEVSAHKYSSPNKLFEAMMFGKPIIVSKNTGMDKIVEKYSCGITVEYGVPEELQRAVTQLAKMKRNGDNLYGQNGRRAYETNFHPNIMKKRLLELYEEIV